MERIIRWLCVLGLVLCASTPTQARTDLIKARVSGFAHVDGISLFYQIYGKGPPILLIPGGLSSADVWHRQIKTLSAHHCVIVADSRGQGRSTRDRTPITYELMARDYVALLDELHVSRVALVGWSDGGIIGLDIAMHHPERLSRMFIQAANATPDGALANVKARAEGTAIPPMGHYDKISDEIEALWANEPNFTPAELATITVPTVIVIGDHDEAISREHTERLASAIPGAEFLLLPHVGHSAPLEDPVGYARAVLDFVDAPLPKPRPALQQRADQAGEAPEKPRRHQDATLPLVEDRRAAGG
jgi:pimeloyl-ACP methyl ester carboxylesterase